MKNLKRYRQLFENQQELTQEQKDWLDKCTKGTWKVNPQTGLVDIKGGFDCERQGLTDFNGVKFGQVSLYFDCSTNELKSLEGAPQICETFDCSHNELKSLEGLPDGFKVGGSFYCYNNELKSLKGLPDGFMVGRDFECYDNPISERAIKGVVKRMGDKKISLEQAVAEYWESIPEDDKIYLAKHHPTLPEKDKRIYRAIELNMKRR